MSLTREELRIVYATLRWARIYQQHSKYIPPSGIPTDADAAHSSLLIRLLSGFEPYAEVPPVVYGYPNYEEMAGKDLDPRLGKGFNEPKIKNPRLEGDG